MTIRHLQELRRIKPAVALYFVTIALVGFAVDGGVYAVLFNELQAVGMKSSIKWSPRPDGILRFREISKSN